MIRAQSQPERAPRRVDAVSIGAILTFTYLLTLGAQAWRDPSAASQVANAIIGAGLAGLYLLRAPRFADPHGSPPACGPFGLRDHLRVLRVPASVAELLHRLLPLRRRTFLLRGVLASGEFTKPVHGRAQVPVGAPDARGGSPDHSPIPRLVGAEWRDGGSSAGHASARGTVDVPL